MQLCVPLHVLLQPAQHRAHSSAAGCTHASTQLASLQRVSLHAHSSITSSKHALAKQHRLHLRTFFSEMAASAVRHCSKVILRVPLVFTCSTFQPGSSSAAALSELSNKFALALLLQRMQPGRQEHCSSIFKGDLVCAFGLHLQPRVQMRQARKQQCAAHSSIS